MEYIRQEANFCPDNDRKSRKRKLEEDDHPTTSSNSEWNSSRLLQYFMCNDRLTRCKLAKAVSCTSKDVTGKVYRMKCKRESFPLLDHHCSLAGDIATKYGKVKHGSLKQGPELPNIAQSNELLLTVVTNGDIKEDLPLIVRKQNLGLVTYEQITEEMIQTSKESVCCLVFEHSRSMSDIKEDVVRVSLHDACTVVKPEIFKEDIRKALTDYLGEPLFLYAEEIVEKSEKLLQDPNRVVEQAIQAAHGLLNRRRTSKRHAFGRIPGDVADQLNMMASDGVLAFGIFSTGMTVFVDEKRSMKGHRQKLKKKVNRACSKIDKSPRIEFTSKSLLRPSSIKQGSQLQNKATRKVGTLGMVTRAQDKREPENNETIAVALTSGHYFKEGNVAIGYEDARQQTRTDLGECIASLPRSTDVAVIKISKPNGFSLNFYNENERLCNCIPMKQVMRIHDIVYKRGATSGLTKGYIRSPDFRINKSKDTSPLCNLEEGYLIEGDGNKAFAEEGDSGSVVFFPDLEDEEKETVQIVSIQSSVFDEKKARKLEIPSNISYTVRADKCFEKLRDEKKIEIHLPAKKEMN